MESQITQFGNPHYLCDAWYPIMPSKKLKRARIHRFDFCGEPIILYRNAQGAPHALYAYCSHMGAPLQAARVKGSSVVCAFHSWVFSKSGEVEHSPACYQRANKERIRSYVVKDHLGCLWIWSGSQKPEKLPLHPELLNKNYSSSYIGKSKISAHGHMVMAGICDIRHFAHLHKMKSGVSYKHTDGSSFWSFQGEFHPQDPWMPRLARFLIGKKWSFTAELKAGASIQLTYGPHWSFFSRTKPRTPLYLITGFLPLTSGESEAHFFVLQPKRCGPWGFLKTQVAFFLTLLITYFFNKDDKKILSEIKFDPNKKLPEADASISECVRYLKNLPGQDWPPSSNYNLGRLNRTTTISLNPGSSHGQGRDSPLAHH